MITVSHINKDTAQFTEAANLIIKLSAQNCSVRDVLFFDIETTGLSPATSYLYLIGCMYLEDGQVINRQFFSEGITEEALLIHEFDLLRKQHAILAHFNGQTFDIPYIEKKRDRLGIEAPKKDIFSFDIFRALKPLKKAFGLSSMSQKSLEVFAGLNRADIYNGGELIDFYNRYIAYKRLEEIKARSSASGYIRSEYDPENASSSELLDALLLHNYEDVLGMLKVAELLSVADLFAGGFTVDSTGLDESDMQFTLTLSVDNDASVTPFELGREYHFHDGRLFRISAADEHRLTVTLPVVSCELKLFYPNYKDYVYLPAEDSAIHKSLGDFVDRSLKQKCTRSNCYTRHTKAFLPWPPEIKKSDTGMCLFRENADDRFGYICIDEATAGSNMHEYVCALFTSLS